jgi:hypothetical protein
MTTTNVHDASQTGEGRATPAPSTTPDEAAVQALVRLLGAAHDCYAAGVPLPIVFGAVDELGSDSLCQRPAWARTQAERYLTDEEPTAHRAYLAGYVADGEMIAIGRDEDEARAALHAWAWRTENQAAADGDCTLYEIAERADEAIDSARLVRIWACLDLRERGRNPYELLGEVLDLPADVAMLERVFGPGLEVPPPRPEPTTRPPAPPEDTTPPPTLDEIDRLRGQIGMLAVLLPSDVLADVAGIMTRLVGRPLADAVRDLDDEAPPVHGEGPPSPSGPRVVYVPPPKQDAQAPDLARYAGPFEDDAPACAALPTSRACGVAHQIHTAAERLESAIAVEADPVIARQRLADVRRLLADIAGALDEVAIDLGRGPDLRPAA